MNFLTSEWHGLHPVSDCHLINPAAWHWDVLPTASRRKSRCSKEVFEVICGKQGWLSYYRCPKNVFNFASCLNCNSTFCPLQGYFLCIWPQFPLTINKILYKGGKALRSMTPFSYQTIEMKILFWTLFMTGSTSDYVLLSQLLFVAEQDRTVLLEDWIFWKVVQA